MSYFPGRTLEELDEIDWPRFIRAITIRTIGAVEGKRIAHQAGHLKSSEMLQSDWEAIAKNEEILDRDSRIRMRKTD